jgi:dTDP-4-dehydrorhamnose reductase
VPSPFIDSEPFGSRQVLIVLHDNAIVQALHLELELAAIVILGAGGLLGSELVNVFERTGEYRVVALSHKKADVTDEAGLAETFAQHTPCVIINCAALIDVEYCETHPFEAWKVNALGAGAVVHAARTLLHPPAIVHMSTAYVFGNEKTRFTESDEARPVNSYGLSKLMGETLVETEAKAARMKYTIVRTSWLYGPTRKTFVDSLVEKFRAKIPFYVVGDQFGDYTSAQDLAEGIRELVLGESASGIYHLCNASVGGVTRYDAALLCADTLGLDRKLLKRVSWTDIFRVPYPVRAVLESTKFRKLPDWKKSLGAYFRKQYGKTH